MMNPKGPWAAMDSPKTRLHVESDLERDNPVSLSPAHAHFLANVLRLGKSDRVSLFNGRDGEWSCRIEVLGRKSATVHPDERIREQMPEPGPWLAFAPVKKARTDFIVEKATELGTEHLLPVITSLTVSRRINTERLAANAREAAEQCGRLTVPGISPPCDLRELMERWPDERPLLIADETGGGRPIADVLGDIAFANDIPPTSCGFLIGPEGGFDDSERRVIVEAPNCHPIDLGPMILRSETAAVAALSCARALTDASN